MRYYTRADLQELIHAQLSNLDAINGLVRIMKEQNELLFEANRKLRDEIAGLRPPKPYPVEHRKRGKAEQQ